MNLNQFLCSHSYDFKRKYKNTKNDCDVFAGGKQTVLRYYGVQVNTHEFHIKKLKTNVLILWSTHSQNIMALSLWSNRNRHYYKLWHFKVEYPVFVASSKLKFHSSWFGVFVPSVLLLPLDVCLLNCIQCNNRQSNIDCCSHSFVFFWLRIAMQRKEIFTFLWNRQCLNCDIHKHAKRTYKIPCIFFLISWHLHILLDIFEFAM